ncbi:MAG TPA: Hpt domain-containing protein, partial [Tahibacter sp.]|nr:Hpt domain-containing protein [Tahibacter sp.]
LDDIAGGDRDVVAGLLRDFIESTGRDLAAVVAAHDGGSADAVARDAHRIKGAARLVGAFALGDAADALERQARLGEKPTKAAVEKLAAAFEALKAWAARDGST